ncbi:uncharacterized protein [Haliotis asinina]|uniref:uncharacterized protein n=1 Tax=Haliotis asinina TaxID=109174 RepID=UPI00353218BC
MPHLQVFDVLNLNNVSVLTAQRKEKSTKLGSDLTGEDLFIRRTRNRSYNQKVYTSTATKSALTKKKSVRFDLNCTSQDHTSNEVNEIKLVQYIRGSGGNKVESRHTSKRCREEKYKRELCDDKLETRSASKRFREAEHRRELGGNKHETRSTGKRCRESQKPCSSSVGGAQVHTRATHKTLLVTSVDFTGSDLFEVYTHQRSSQRELCRGNIPVMIRTNAGSKGTNYYSMLRSRDKNYNSAGEINQSDTNSASRDTVEAIAVQDCIVSAVHEDLIESSDSEKLSSWRTGSPATKAECQPLLKNSQTLLALLADGRLLGRANCTSNTTSGFVTSCGKMLKFGGFFG